MWSLLQQFPAVYVLSGSRHCHLRIRSHVMVLPGKHLEPIYADINTPITALCHLLPTQIHNESFVVFLLSINMSLYQLFFLLIFPSFLCHIFASPIHAENDCLSRDVDCLLWVRYMVVKISQTQSDTDLIVILSQ